MEEIPALTLYGAVLDEELSDGSRSQLPPEQVPMEQLLEAVDRQVDIEAEAMRPYLEALDVYRQARLVWQASTMSVRRSKDTKDHHLGSTAEREQAHARRQAEAAGERANELAILEDENGLTPEQRIQRIARLRRMKEALKGD